MVGPASALHERRQKVLFQQLPELHPNAAGMGLADPQLNAIMTHVATMNDQARLDGADRHDQKKQASLPTAAREKFWQLHHQQAQATH